MIAHIHLAHTELKDFQGIILGFYRKYARDLPWRKTRSPYNILVSEVMLQQTQAERVIPKYRAFIDRFPDSAALARARMQDILKLWQGLGYNRRAVALKESARQIVRRHAGSVPATYDELLELPGVGPYTAAAVCVFAYNQPRIFIETNIRTVYIHSFFAQADSVTDEQILPYVAATLYRRSPRTWYNALMDYGVLLKKLYGNPGRKSAHYTRQSPFSGSNRQIRGLIIRVLIDEGPCSEAELVARVGTQPGRARPILRQLQSEGLVRVVGTDFSLA